MTFHNLTSSELWEGQMNMQRTVGRPSVCPPGCAVAGFDHSLDSPVNGGKATWTAAFPEYVCLLVEDQREQFSAYRYAVMAD